VRVRTRELAAAQSEVARAEKLSALGRMLAQLSHELNNPMNVVANNVGPLKEYIAELTAMLAAFRAKSPALPDGGAELESAWKAKEIDFIVKDSSEALSVIERAAQRVCAIQSDLAAFLRGDGVQKTEGDLNADVRETVRMVRHGLPAGVTIEEAYGDLPRVVYDAGRMNQVFLNLLQNAVFAVAGAGTIRVKTWADREIAHVAISDDGPGIPEDVRERIFEPFFTTKPVGKGTGLGLSICRQIVVEQHGGSIRLTDSAPGATFDVALPVDG
jgi:signal transduction histidine kinase